MTDLTLLITSSPFTGEHHRLAQRFIRAASRNQRIKRVFFYQDAVLVANHCQQPPQGQQSLLSDWLAISKELGVPLQACIANSLRRGIADSQEQNRYNLSAATMSPGFSLAGLGEIAQAYADGDRVVQF